MSESMWVDTYTGEYFKVGPGGLVPCDDPRRVAPLTQPVVPKRHPLSARFHAVLAELGALHDAKQADYGVADDPFANVRGSQAWGIAPWVGAMVRANDKLKRLQVYAKTGTLANEGARDSFMDLAVYAVIALVLWEETHGGA